MSEQAPRDRYRVVIFANRYDIPMEMAEAYFEGKELRHRGDRLVVANPHRDVRLAWFRAGWHDQDIEMGNSVIRGAA